MDNSDLKVKRCRIYSCMMNGFHTYAVSFENIIGWKGSHTFMVQATSEEEAITKAMEEYKARRNV